MRTSLNINDDALLYAKQIARSEKISLGSAVSQLIRQSYNLTAAKCSGANGKYRLVQKRDGEVITSEYVYRLLDQLDIELCK